MKIKKCFIVFILASCIIQCNAQNRAHDSIIKMLESNIHDTIKCIRLYNYIESGLEETVWPIYNDKLLFLTEQAIKKSKGRLKVIYLKYNALAISNKGYQYINLGDYTKAKKYYLIALEIQKNNNLIKEMGSTYINLGFLSNKEGNTVLALNYYHSALNIFLKINDINQAAVAYNNLAFIFGIENEFTQALKYYQNAFKMHLQMKDYSGMATVLNNISIIYAKEGDPDCKGTKEECLKNGIKNAFQLSERAIKIEDSIHDKIELAGSLNVLAGYYDEYGDPSCWDKNDCILLSKNKALELYKRSLSLRIETNHTSGLAFSYYSLAKHMLLQNKLNEAEVYGQKSFDLAKKMGSPEFIKNAAKILSEIYKKQNNYEKAILMYELFIQKKDSISNNSSKKAAIRKGYQLEYEKKATADSVKVVEEKKLSTVKLKQEKTQRYFLYGGLGLTALFGIFMFNRFRITQKQKNIIQQQKTLVDQQKHLVDEKQKEILDSIRYAKRIQQSLLPTEKYIYRILKNKRI